MRKHYRTRCQVVTEGLRKDILWGSLDPGRRLSQDEIALRYGVSRIPVREALRLLTAEGLIELKPHREAVVRRHSPTEIQEICWIRGILEPQAARLAVERMTPGTVKALEGFLAKMEQLGAVPDVTEWLALNRSFHLAIYRAAERPHTLRLIRELFDQSVRYIRAYLKSAEQFEQAHLEHRGMLEACASKNPDRLEALVKKHIDSMLAILQEGHSGRERPAT